jgi:hypothetical protein
MAEACGRRNACRWIAISTVAHPELLRSSNISSTLFKYTQPRVTHKQYKMQYKYYKWKRPLGARKTFLIETNSHAVKRLKSESVAGGWGIPPEEEEEEIY